MVLNWISSPEQEAASFCSHFNTSPPRQIADRRSKSKHSPENPSEIDAILAWAVKWWMSLSLYCPLGQSGVAIDGATNAINTRPSKAVTVSLLFSAPSNPHYLPHQPYLQTLCSTYRHFVLSLPSFAHIKRPRWRSNKPSNRHLRSHRKIGDCEQSVRGFTSLLNYRGWRTAKDLSFNCGLNQQKKLFFVLLS